MLIEISEINMKEFLEWANGRAFCNSGQHVCDRLATIFEATPAEDRYGRQLGAVKPLAQYLNEYLTQEMFTYTNRDDEKTIGIRLDALKNVIEQALDAYESTENVKIRIERV